VTDTPGRPRVCCHSAIRMELSVPDIVRYRQFLSKLKTLPFNSALYDYFSLMMMMMIAVGGSVNEIAD